MITKIANKIKKILKETYYVTKNFGINYGVLYFFTSFFRKFQYKTRLMGISILEKEYNYLFKSIDIYNSQINFDEKQKNIFLYWAQGFDKLPEFQIEVLRRIKSLYDDYNIILIDDSNYDRYINININIKKLYKEKKITVQTFSDILRFNLIYEYGGVWCDMTNLFFKRVEFDKYIKKYGFWSINHDSNAKKNLWGKIYPVTYTTFLFGTFKGNDIMRICVNFYNDYYEKHDFCIDYFMNDFILIMCMKNKVCNDMLNHIPYIKSSPFFISEYLNGKRQIKKEEILECPQKINNKTVNWNCLHKELNKIGV